MCSNDRVDSEATLPGQEPRALRDHAPDCALRRDTGARCTCPVDVALDLSVRLAPGATRRTPAEVELP